MAGQDVGTRLRERRLAQNLRQVDLAQAMGISPAYLNLIEHNRRRIGDHLIAKAANALGMPVADLEEGAGTAQIAELQRALAQDGLSEPETQSATDLIRLCPDWAGIFITQSEKHEHLRRAAKEMRDQLAHNPQLSASLHEILSAVTSIRSTASILAGDDPIDAEWQRVFHRNIHTDALRLAEASQELARFLEGPERDGVQATPVEIFNDLVAERGHNFPALDTGKSTPAALAEHILATDVAPADRDAVRELLSPHLSGYAADVAAVPQAALLEEGAARDWDPLALMQHFGVGSDVILRRLGRLARGPGVPEFGLVIVDGGGAIRELRPVTGFSLPRSSDACPVWPSFDPVDGRAITKCSVATGTGGGDKYLCYRAESRSAPLAYGAPEQVSRIMLLRPDPVDRIPDRFAGMACRICDVVECSMRREPSLLGI